MKAPSSRVWFFKALAFVLSVGVLAAGSSVAQTVAPQQLPPPVAPLVPIATLDIDRYMGAWYEVARFPNRFQRDCVGPARAQYALLPSGRVSVLNQCPLPEGRTDEAAGEARRIGAAGSATLQVRFAPAWLSWLPMVWGNYWVVDLDDAYTLAAVSEPKREFLWILSREPEPDAQALKALEARLAQRGFDMTRLQRAGPGR